MSSFTCHLPPALCTEKNTCTPIQSQCKHGALFIERQIEGSSGERWAREASVPGHLLDVQERFFNYHSLLKGRHFSATSSAISVFITISWSKHLFLKFPGILFTQNHLQSWHTELSKSITYTFHSLKYDLFWSEMQLVFTHSSSMISYWRTGLLPGKFILEKYGAQNATVAHIFCLETHKWQGPPVCQSLPKVPSATTSH